MSITLPDLPYDKRALAPHISERTLEFHHGKHHQGYVDKTNKAIKDGPFDDASLEEIVREADGSDQKLFNSAAQAWNHNFYWPSMSPEGRREPQGDLAAAVKRDFGGLDGFKETFLKAGKNQFGAGWTWLIVRNGKLEVFSTHDAETPLTDDGATPLLTMDVWEHAYYLDCQHRREDYIKKFLDKLLNWDFAAKNLDGAW